MKGATNRKHRQRGPRGGFLRRSPFLVSYWQGQQLFFENYLTRKQIAASSETAALLDIFSSWKREEAMFRRWPEFTAQSLRLAIRRLVQESFLQRSTRRSPTEDSRAKALRDWKAWNPAASFFPVQTKGSCSA